MRCCIRGACWRADPKACSAPAWKPNCPGPWVIPVKASLWNGFNGSCNPTGITPAVPGVPGVCVCNPFLNPTAAPPPKGASKPSKRVVASKLDKGLNCP